MLSLLKQEWGTLITGGTWQQDQYIRQVLPTAWANGANGFMYWCMRDITKYDKVPYSIQGKETLLGMFEGNSSTVKAGMKFYLEFAKEISRAKSPPSLLPEDNASAIGLYVPWHYYQHDDSHNPGNFPNISAVRATSAYHLLRSLHHVTRVVRGGLPLPTPETKLRVLVITSSILDDAEISDLHAWVHQGGMLVWHGLTRKYFDTTTTNASVVAMVEDLVGAKLSPVSARAYAGTSMQVSFNGHDWTFSEFLDAPPLRLQATAAARVWHATSCGSDVVVRAMECPPVALRNRCGRGAVFAAVPIVEAEPMALMGERQARDVWALWYAGALEALGESPHLLIRIDLEPQMRSVSSLGEHCLYAGGVVYGWGIFYSLLQKLRESTSKHPFKNRSSPTCQRLR